MTMQSALGVLAHASLRQEVSGLSVFARTAALGLVVGLAACGGDSQSDRRADVEIRGTDPSGSTSAVAAVGAAPSGQAPQAGAGGVVDYGSYQTIVARQGDTVEDLAARIGLSASELGAYNGLTPSHTLREGDELVLPPRPGGYSDTMVAAAAPVGTDAMPLDSGIETMPLPGAGAPDAGASDGGVPVEALAGAEAGTGEAGDQSWSPDLAAAAIERSTGLRPDGSLGAPPSSAEPVPPAPPARRELESPSFSQYQTDSAGMAAPPPVSTEDVAVARTEEPAQATASRAPGVRLLRPVEGTVASGFNKSPGPDRNDGVDFAAPAGAPVVAAADGEVALVSQSLGGLGTIVLLRHPNDLLTVYGRVDDVTVKKGDIVKAGEAIGVVSNAAAPAEPRMHFEVRRGAESLDPMQFL